MSSFKKVFCNPVRTEAMPKYQVSDFEVALLLTMSVPPILCLSQLSHRLVVVWFRIHLLDYVVATNSKRRRVSCQDHMTCDLL